MRPRYSHPNRPAHHAVESTHQARAHAVHGKGVVCRAATPCKPHPRYVKIAKRVPVFTAARLGAASDVVCQDQLVPGVAVADDPQRGLATKIGQSPGAHAGHHLDIRFDTFARMGSGVAQHA